MIDSGLLGLTFPTGASVNCSQRRVLCSLGVKVREAQSTRRFRFWNWQIHMD